MHADEVETDAGLVRRLLAGQFPRWAGLPVDPVESYGTDHDIYRLGDHLAARLPRIGWATAQAATEARWLPRLAPQLPLALPVQLARGHPAEGYPFEWSVYEWLPGENADGTIDDLEQAAVDLAGFVRALRRVDTTGAHPRPVGRRGGPLAEGDEAGPPVGRPARRPDRRRRRPPLLAGVAGGPGVGRPRGLGARRPAAGQPAGGRRAAVGGHRLRRPQRRRSRL